jgi:hypothetical protein
MSASRGVGERSMQWRSVLVGAPLVYGAGTVVGDLLSVWLLGAPVGAFVSGVGVGAACVLVSLGLGRVVAGLGRTEPRSIGGIARPRASIQAGGAVLFGAFLFGFSLAVAT